METEKSLKYSPNMAWECCWALAHEVGKKSTIFMIDLRFVQCRVAEVLTVIIFAVSAINDLS